MMPCEFVADFFVFIIICIILWRAIKSSKLAHIQYIIYHYWLLVCALEWNKTGKKIPIKEHIFSDKWTIKYLHFHLTNSSIFPTLIFEVTENYDFSLVSSSYQSLQNAEQQLSGRKYRIGKEREGIIATEWENTKLQCVPQLVLGFFSLFKSDGENMSISPHSSTLTMRCKFSALLNYFVQQTLNYIYSALEI